METGRDDASKEYIEKFLQALGLNWELWELEIGGGDGESKDLRAQCHENLDAIEPSKLELIYGLLSNF